MLFQIDISKEVTTYVFNTFGTVNNGRSDLIFFLENSSNPDYKSYKPLILMV